MGFSSIKLISIGSPSTLSGCSMVGESPVKSDLDGLKIIICFFVADWTAISSNFVHRHSSSKLLMLMSILQAGVGLSLVLGAGGDVTNTLIEFCTIFGTAILSNSSAFVWVINVFCVAKYSRRNPVCCWTLCKLEGLSKWAKHCVASSNFLSVIACLLIVYWMWSSARFQPLKIKIYFISTKLLELTKIFTLLAKTASACL